MPSLKTFDNEDGDFPSKWKRIGTLIVDFFVGVIFTFLFFGAIGYPTYTNLSIAKESRASYEQSGITLVKIADASKLQKAKDEEYSSLLSMEETGRKYLTTLLKTSCMKNGIQYQELDGSQKVDVEVKVEDTFENVENDFIYYYFSTYKKENSIGSYVYDDVDYSNSIRLLVNEKILKLSLDNRKMVPDDFDPANDYFYLNHDYTLMLMDYLSFGDTNEPFVIYNQLLNLYGRAASIGINEIETCYQPYKDAYASLRDGYNAYSKGYIWTVIICYIPGALVTFFLFPLCFGKGRTIGQRFFGLKTVDKVWDPISVPFLLLKSFVQSIEEFWMTFLIPIFMGSMEFTSVGLIGSLSMFMLCFFTFLVCMLSLIFFAFNKDSQTIADLSSLSYVVKVSSDLERGKEEEDSRNGRDKD